MTRRKTPKFRRRFPTLNRFTKERMTKMDTNSTGTENTWKILLILFICAFLYDSIMSSKLNIISILAILHNLTSYLELLTGVPFVDGFFEGIMGRKSKVLSKQRLDKYYHLAKEQGYRSRSAFKLLQLNKKYRLLESSQVLVDLCAAPGGWMQVARKCMPVSSIIIGVDLVPIKSIKNTIAIVGDITKSECRTCIKRELGDLKADVVLHDGAPNVGMGWEHDAHQQSELVISALRLATGILKHGGVFLTKVFRSKDYNCVVWVLNQLFEIVDVTKPASSRGVSAEIFVFCKGYLSPKSIDPRLLDPGAVFSEVPNMSQNTGNVLRPSSMKQKVDGYNGGELLEKKATLVEFIAAESPKTFLGVYDRIVCDGKDAEMYLPFMTEEIRVCFSDLQVLGVHEYKSLLAWRKDVIKRTTPEGQKEDEEVVMEGSEEEDILEELDSKISEESKRLRKTKKKELMKKARERLRMKAANSGVSQDLDNDNTFSTKRINSDVIEKIRDVDISEMPFVEEKIVEKPEKEKTKIQEKRKDEYFDQYIEGIDNMLSGEVRAKSSILFSRRIFREFGEEEELLCGGEEGDKDLNKKTKKALRRARLETMLLDDDEISDVGDDMGEGDITEDQKLSFLTPEGITMALKMRRENKGKDEIIDDSFNRYSFGPEEDLPEWFRKDEMVHSRKTLPVTKEAMEIFRSKTKVWESRPCRKVLEAKFRRKRKMEKIMKSIKDKSEAICDREELSESQKSTQMQKLVSKNVDRKKSVKLIVSKKSGIGSGARVSGPYKLVDRRMKKDKRALKNKKRVKRRR